VKSVVTGAAGFVGSHLCEYLVAEGDHVLGIDSFTDYYDTALKESNVRAVRGADRFELLRGDLRDLPLADLLDGADVVYHLAGQPGVRPSWGREFETYVSRNVLATQALLEAARGVPLTKFVYASSSSVYGDAEAYPTAETLRPRPVSPYGVTKLAAEHLCELYRLGFGVPTVSLRLFTVYGPRQRPDMAFNRFCAAAANGRRIVVFGDGEQRRDFTFVGDIVAATIAAAEAPDAIGGIYNIGGGSQASVNEALALIAELAGRPLEVEHVPQEHGDVRDTGADIGRARADLGFEARTSLRDGLAAQWTAGRNGGADGA
jgi:nucleoside-diphosphate-sugar epimerase